jgi:hypothetical protein
MKKKKQKIVVSQKLKDLLEERTKNIPQEVKDEIQRNFDIGTDLMTIRLSKGVKRDEMPFDELTVAKIENGMKATEEQIRAYLDL